MSETIKLGPFIIELRQPNDSRCYVITNPSAIDLVSMDYAVLMFKRIKELEAENGQLKTLVKSVSKDRNDTLEQQLNRVKELEAENGRLNTVIPYQQPALIKLLITMTEDYNSGRIRLAPSAYNTLIKAVVAELQGETI